MVRERSPNRNRAFEIYKQNNGNITSKAIANILNEKATNIRTWKTKDTWDEKLGLKKRKRGAPKGNQNALGNNGGAPKGNQNARILGFYSKYMPKKVFNIYKDILDGGFGQLDLLWHEICKHSATIIESEKILRISSSKDHTKVLKKQIEGKNGVTKEYQILMAYEKQLKKLKELSNARKTLSTMIEKYETLLHRNWELATEEQKARIEVLKSKIIKNEKNKEDKIDAYFAKLEEGIKNAK